jgi:hypothetical protein
MTNTLTEKLKPTIDYLRLRMRVIERLSHITKHEIGSHGIIKDYSTKKKTFMYYDCTIEKYMKCTINIHLVGFTLSNIREDKKMVIVKRTIELDKYKH